MNNFLYYFDDFYVLSFFKKPYMSLKNQFLGTHFFLSSGH